MTFASVLALKMTLTRTQRCSVTCLVRMQWWFTRKLLNSIYQLLSMWWLSLRQLFSPFFRTTLAEITRRFFFSWSVNKIRFISIKKTLFFFSKAILVKVVIRSKLIPEDYRLVSGFGWFSVMPKSHLSRGVDLFKVPLVNKGYPRNILIRYTAVNWALKIDNKTIAEPVGREDSYKRCMSPRDELSILLDQQQTLLWRGKARTKKNF